VFDIMNSADASPIVSRKIIALHPSYTRSTQLHGITLIDDAAHTMSPFGGGGVNLALLDAYEIVQALAKGVPVQEALVEVDKVFGTYEQAM